MSDSVTFADENLDRSVRRRAEYDDGIPGDLILSIPKRSGGTITVPLLKNARSNLEREEHQENTLLRIKPLAEIANDLPVVSGSNAPVHKDKGVALLRPGYLYVFRGNSLWRELEVDASGLMSDVDLNRFRADAGDSSELQGSNRSSEGEWLSDVLVPVFLQGQGVMHEMRMAYSELQWDWAYIRRLEQDDRAREARTTGVGHAWAATVADGLTFEKGFPAAAIADVSELRSRDLGIELMLENPRDFLPGFEGPGDSELCIKLGKLLKQNEALNKSPGPGAATQNGEGNTAANIEKMMDNPIGYVLESAAENTSSSGEGHNDSSQAFDLGCQPGTDQLADFRSQKGVVCVAIPDPLFKLRHSLSQLHLALHYLDAVDVYIQKNPMAHSAMLIRQAVFDPSPNGSPSALAQYSEAIDREKLDEVLDTAEKNHAIRVIEQHVDELRDLMKWRRLDPFFDDYRECNDVAICEAYLLIADKLNVLQQIPGVLKVQGVSSRRDRVLTSLKQWILDGTFLSDWVPESEDSGHVENEALPYTRLQQLVQDQTEIDEELLKRLHLQSLVYLEKQLNEQDEGIDSGVKGVAGAGKVAGMISGALNEWSSSVLTVCKRLIEADEIMQVELQRIMQAASSTFVFMDPGLKGINVMDRAGAIKGGAILGVSGNGLSRGLTNFDRTEGLLTRAKDYLCADLVNESGELMASSSPSRAADAVEEAVHKVAGGTMVFAIPDDHPEARKLSLLKVDFAKRVGEVVDGAGVSRGLVVLAAFNVFLELNNLNRTSQREDGTVLLARSKMAGATADLIAASFKLSEVLGRPATAAGTTTRTYQIATRPLFDMKNWVLIGNRLKAVRATTLVRVAGLATFIAGAAGAGLSFWEMRISLSNKDFDAATGHAIAMTGSAIVLASPLMHSLLAIPGWGWAIFGLTLAVGGGLYAGSATDDAFEQLLKRGPWGTYPDDSLPGQDDRAYYSQLLALLSPIQVTAQRYADVEPDPALTHPDYAPKPDDYVITVQLPLVSRIKLHREGGDDLPDSPFRLLVQEVAYYSSTSNVSTPGSAAPVSSTQMLKATPLTKVTARQSLPLQSAVRFLVRREIPDSDYQSLYYQESVTTQVRVGLQATLDTALGPLVFPAPVFEDYEPFSLARHSQPPPKERTVLNPYAQPKSPYWYFTEVSV